MIIETVDGVGLIPVGVLLVWEDRAQHHLKVLYSDFKPDWEPPFNLVHPLTIGLTKDARQKLLDSGANCWQLDTVLGKTIEVTPHFHPGVDSHEKQD